MSTADNILYFIQFFILFLQPYMIGNPKYVYICIYENKQLFLIQTFNNTQMQGSNPILILGGSNFMGKSMCNNLSKHFPTHKVYLINRGKIYWNNQVYTENPNIQFFYGDRNEHKEMTKAISYLNQKNNITAQSPWAAVIDYTSYKWRDIQSIAKPLKNNTQIYIFISTDSIYNNTPFDGVKIKEDKYSLQQMYKKQKGTKISDKYGYDKLKCEIYLQRRKNLPYINLRLPDVLGPYDNTNRYWCSMEWIKQSHKNPIQINSKDKNNKLSFVYSKDLSQLIIQLIKNRQKLEKQKSYNLSFKQEITNQQFLIKIGKSLSKPIEPKFKEVDKQQTNSFFPSVNYTCIDSDLAIKELKWTPSLLEQCIKDTTQFFEKAHKYETQYKEMKKELRKKLQDHQ